MSPLLATRAGDSAQGYGLFGAVAASSSFESIATATGAGNPTSITFSSIPQTYKHLQIRSSARNLSGSTLGVAMYVTVNGTANSDLHRLFGDGTSATADGANSGGSGGNGYIDWGQAGGGTTANIYGCSIVDVIDYTSTTKNKTFRLMSGTDLNGTGRIYLNSFAWFTTSAITSITITEPQGTGFTTASSFALYGIKG
jgi:hypothetical protein